MKEGEEQLESGAVQEGGPPLRGNLDCGQIVC